MASVRAASVPPGSPSLVSATGSRAATGTTSGPAVRTVSAVWPARHHGTRGGGRQGDAPAQGRRGGRRQPVRAGGLRGAQLTGLGSGAARGAVARQDLPFSRRGRDGDVGSGKPSAPFGGGAVVSVTARDTDGRTVAPGEGVRQTGGPVCRLTGPFGWLARMTTVGWFTGDNGHRTRSERVPRSSLGSAQRAHTPEWAAAEGRESQWTSTSTRRRISSPRTESRCCRAGPSRRPRRRPPRPPSSAGPSSSRRRSRPVAGARPVG